VLSRYDPVVIGPYRVVEKIGRGTMGQVFRAVDGDGRHWAVKVMMADLAEDADLTERFQREAMAASLLDHPNVTHVHDYGEDGGRLFMVMELLTGTDLKERIDKGPLLPPYEKLSVMVQVGAGMAYVHGRSIIHRDLKPANIHVSATGQAKIMDFGLVKVGDSHMTRTGTLMGSPAFMSPEVLMGNRADARSDVFSLGAVFYELLSGQRAFPGRGLAEIMMNVLKQEPRPLATVAPIVPPPLVFLVERCLRKDPARRYQNAGELHAALEVAQAALSRPPALGSR
jgi:eukaryotic-like serine/threonine-protein kinase